MRKIILGSLLAGYIGAAAAAGAETADARDLVPDYSARAYYRVDFGGPAAHRQSVGLRFDNQLTAQGDRPAMFQAAIDSSAATHVTLRGVELRGVALASHADSNDDSVGKKGFWAEWGTTTLIGVSIVALLAIGASGSGSGDTGGTTGSGGS